MMQPRSLDLSQAKVLIDQPIAIFEIHEFFKPQQYQQLDAQFPEKALFPSRYDTKGGKYYLSDKMPEFHAFIKTSPVWQELYEYFSHPDTVNRFYDITQSFESERPQEEKHPWVLRPAARNKNFLQKYWQKLLRYHAASKDQTRVYLTFEFSYLESGCYIPPHTDVPGKLISLMIYFPDENVDYPQGVGTEFYQGRGGTSARPAWKVGMLKDELMKEFLETHEAFYTSAFSPNKLVGFIKSSKSWHGVPPLNLPAHATRRSLNINYFLA